MIWIWIAAAVLISWLFCKRGIGWYHYIWLLLPIEMYGVTIAGATVKPYMLFGICIIVSDFIRNKTIRVHTTIIAVTFALIISDFLTGFVTSSVMQHIMFILVLIIGYCYQNYQRGGIEFEGICQAALATTLGYGIVFTFAWVLFRYGVTNNGIYAFDRMETGIILKLTSSGGIVSSRLRGFCIDPNSVITTLIPGAAYALTNIVYRKKEIAKSLFAIASYLTVVICSGSRMALICSLVMLLIFYVVGYKRSQNKRHMTAISIAAIGALLIVFVFNVDAITHEISEIWAEMFGDRASFDSEYGRLTIWKTIIRYLIDNNKEWFGVGQNQIYLLTEKGRACHNTWFEWICGTGVIFGSVIDLWFILAPVRFKKRAKGLGEKELQNARSIIIAYITVLLCLSTVDNITNSVLLFLMLILRYGTINRKQLVERIA